MAALKCSRPQEFAIEGKRMLMLCPGVHRAGGGGGCWEAWAHQRLTDALLICGFVTDTSACGRPGSSSK